MKKTKKLPAVLTREEVQALFDATKNLKHKCILMTAYGSGLRVSGVTRLKISDIDSKNMSIFVRQGKGKRTGIPFYLKEILSFYGNIGRNIIRQIGSYPAQTSFLPPKRKFDCHEFMCFILTFIYGRHLH